MKSNFQAAKQFIKMRRGKRAESLSGPGSNKYQASDARDFLQDSINKHSIKKILDLGCGDWNWMEDVDLQGAEYLGIDCDDDMIQQNLAKYGSDKIKFQVGDIFSVEIPDVDLVICRDVLFHVRQELALSLINKLKKIDDIFFFSTSFNQQDTNVDIQRYCDIEDWGYYRINLLQDPFNLDDTLIDSRSETAATSDRSVCLFRCSTNHT